MHREKIAYAVGALEKFAEYNVSALAFCEAAVRSGDPAAIKVAEVIAEYALIKQANRGRAAMEGLEGLKNQLSEGLAASKARPTPPRVPGSSGARDVASEWAPTAVTGRPGSLSADAAQGPMHPNVHAALNDLDMGGGSNTQVMGRMTDRVQPDATRLSPNPIPQFSDMPPRPNDAMVHVGPAEAAEGLSRAQMAGLGAGALGLTGATVYGAGDADTFENRVRNALGMGGTQSRMGYGLEQMGLG
jgi:hypothetical protein